MAKVKVSKQVVTEEQEPKKKAKKVKAEGANGADGEVKQRGRVSPIAELKLKVIKKESTLRETSRRAAILEAAKGCKTVKELLAKTVTYGDGKESPIKPQNIVFLQTQGYLELY